MAKSWYETVPKDVWGDEPQQDVQATGMAPTQTKTATLGIGSPQSYYSQGMESLTGLANGTAPIYKSTENRLSQQFGGAALAATGAAKQGAAQAGLSTEGIGSVEQTTLKNLEGERSKLMGDIASQKQAGVSSAANSLVSGGISGMSQQLAERQQGFNEQTYQDTKKQSDWNRMLEYYDPSTTDGLAALQSAYTQMFGGTAPDMNVLKEQREYNRTKQQQDVAIGSASVAQAEQQVRDTNLASTMNLVTAGYSVDRINEILGTNYTADEYAKMRENTSTYFQSKGIDMQEATLYGYDLPDGTHIQGSLEIAAGQFDLQGKTYEDQRNELYGYTDANGNVITGKYESLSNSEKRAADAMYGYEAKDSEGNTIVDDKGNPVRIKGTLELQNSADQIAQQGMTLNEAQVKGYVDENGIFQKGSVQIAAEAAGINVSSAYGYSYNTVTGQVVTDPTEIQKLKAEGKLETVDGAIALAGKQFGLQEGSLDLQYQQLFGTDREGNVIKDANGDPVKGTMYYMNSEDQRAAYQLYGGMAVDAEGNPILGEDGKQLRVAGTLEIMQDEQLLKERGMSVEEAAVFGYDKKVDGKDVHVYGSLEIESEKLDIIRQEAENQKNSEAGVALSSYFGSMKNVTGWNYQNDPQAQKLLQDYWESTGNTGAYDKGWAQNQLVATTISESDAALANLENEQWYKDMVKSDPKMAEQVKTVASLAAMLSVTQGVIPTYNETGDVVGLTDSEGNKIWGTGTTSYSKEDWETVPISDKWSYFEENNAAFPDIQTKQEWLDAGMPHPDEGTFYKSIDTVMTQLTSPVRKSSDMFLGSSSPDTKATLTALYDNIESGLTTDAFNTDKDGGSVAAWAEINEGRKIYIGDKAYTVTRYDADSKAGDRGTLVLTDDKGVPLKITGTESAKKDAGQAATEAAASAAFKQGVTGFMLDGVQELSKGNVGDAALSFLTGGLTGIFKRWKERR